MRQGIVYALRGSSWVKVGFTTDLGQRIEAIDKNVPFKIKLIMSEPGSEADEQLLLAALVQFRARREWFKWSPTVEWVLRYVAQKGLSVVMADGARLLDDLAVYR